MSLKGFLTYLSTSDVLIIHVITFCVKRNVFMSNKTESPFFLILNHPLFQKPPIGKLVCIKLILFGFYADVWFQASLIQLPMLEHKILCDLDVLVKGKQLVHNNGDSAQETT